MKLNSDLMRNIVFGVEDSLVSTAGLVSGIAFAGVSRLTLLLTGTVLIFVEAFSMAIGSLLSDNSAREFEGRAHVSIWKSASSAVAMFFSYFVVGFIVIIPYLFLQNGRALPASIILSIVALFILGIFSGKMSHTHPLIKGFIMMGVGGGAIIIGMIVGTWVNSLV